MMIATTDSTGGPVNNKTILKTSGAVLQSNFLNDVVIFTAGLRDMTQ